jgi:hypothetical protein
MGLADSPKTVVCLTCGARDDQNVLECWSCRRRVRRKRLSGLRIAPSRARPRRGLLLINWMVLIALVAVAAAVLRTTR